MIFFHILQIVLSYFPIISLNIIENAYGVKVLTVVSDISSSAFDLALYSAFLYMRECYPYLKETDIGRVCVLLASEDFKYMSGETLTLQGGLGQRP